MSDTVTLPVVCIKCKKVTRHATVLKIVHKMHKTLPNVKRNKAAADANALLESKCPLCGHENEHGYVELTPEQIQAKSMMPLNLTTPKMYEEE